MTTMREEGVTVNDYGYQTIYQMIMSKELYFKIEVDPKEPDLTSIKIQRTGIDRKAWEEQVWKTVQLYWLMENDGKTLTCANYQEMYRRYFHMDIPLEQLSPSNFSIDLYLSNMIQMRYQGMGENPLYITDNGTINVKPKMKHKILGQLREDAEVIEIKLGMLLCYEAFSQFYFQTPGSRTTSGVKKPIQWKCTWLESFLMLTIFLYKQPRITPQSLD